MRNSEQTTGKILYAVLFLGVVPFILWQWSIFLDEIIELPVIESKVGGGIFIISGLALMLWAMYSLKRYGKGLPMNAFPPEHYVTQGPYRLFSHPIYVGFGILMIGFFILIGSAAGLWIVSSTTILGIIALVLGYENLDLRKRFPDHQLHTIFSLPKNDNKNSTPLNKFRALFWVIGILVLSNFSIKNLITASTENQVDSLQLILPDDLFFDLPGTGIAFLVLTVLCFKRNKDLRAWIISSIIATVIYTLVILFYPGILHFYDIDVSRPVYTVTLVILFISIFQLFKRSNTLGLIFLILGSGILIVNSAYYSLNLISLLVTILILIIAVQSFRIWTTAKNISEKIANSWKEWVFGSIRIINHGFYVGFGCFMGILISGILVGDNYAWAILIFSLVVIIFSALWAQIIEGSEKLKRPYGYYGALVGILFASIVVHIMGFNVWIIIGVISVVMPWVQAVGRLRCLINGCCHGSITSNPNLGIRYYHYRSRVCGISHLKGELLHPTPLYSIIWLGLVGFILLSLWINKFPMSFIFGFYLILTSIGRFVEEAYRGEVQTPIIRGLRLYQWTALLALCIGIIFTCIPSTLFMENNSFGWQSFLSALIGGLFTFIAMGVDFPRSNARFSRLV